MAAERLKNADELAALKLHCRQTEELVPMTRERFVRYIEINEAFHAGLWRLAKSAMLRAAIERIVALPFAAPGALVFSWPAADDGNTEALIAIEHHRALVESIEQREGGRAEAIAREHARLTQRALKRALDHSEAFSRLPGAPLISRPDRNW